MIGRLFLGAVIGAVVLSLWAFVFWRMLPLSQEIVSPLPNEDRVVRVLEAGEIKTGVYHFPLQGADERSPRWLEKHTAGPIGRIFYQVGGMDPNNPTTYGVKFLHFFVTALLAAILLQQALPRLDTYARRAFFLLTAGVFAGVGLGLAAPIWWHHPWGYHLYYLLFYALGWALAGLAMAAVIKPRAA